MMRAKSYSRWTAVIGGILLLWNLIGVAFYVIQATQDLAVLARTDPYQAHLFATMPTWGWLAYLVAVVAGTLGAAALLLRSRWAVPLFMLSVVGIVVQFGRTFLMTDLWAVKGPAAAAFPLFIFLVGLFQLWFAMRLRKQGFLR